jgi:hypothetical protein
LQAKEFAQRFGTDRSHPRTIPFATRFKFEAKNVFVKRLRLGKVIHLDRHVIAPVNLNAHSPAVCESLSF